MRQVINSISDIHSVGQNCTTLDNPFYHHMPAGELCQYADRLPHALSEYTLFATIRSPFTRVPSLHAWYTQTVANPVMCFEQFVFEILDPAKSMFMPCSDFLRGVDEDPIVTKFVRFENLSEDLARVMAECGVRALPEVPHIGRGHTDHTKHIVTRSIRDRIAELYASDLVAFGYE